MDMEIRENLELVGADYESNNQKLVLTFLDIEAGAVRVVNFNRQKYDTLEKKYIDDPEKAAKVDEWCDTYLKTTFDNAKDAIGTKHTVYVYEKFCSLWEAEMVDKFTEDQVGEMITGEIVSVDVDDVAIRVRYKADDHLYESKLGYGIYQENLKQWFTDPIKKNRQFGKFEEKFGVSVENKDQIVGKTIQVEVKKALGKYLYGEMKAFPKKKK